MTEPTGPSNSYLRRLASRQVMVWDASEHRRLSEVLADVEQLVSRAHARRFYVSTGSVEGASGADYRQIGQKLALERVEVVILIQSPGTKEIEAGLRHQNYTGQIIQYAELEHSREPLLELVRPGDAVMLAA